MKRLAWADIMKAFSIMAVVLNHTHIPHEIKQLVYSVCLPAFLLISGIFTNIHLSPIDFFKIGLIKGIAMICHIPLPFFETIAGCLVLWIGTFIISLPFTFVINRFFPLLVGKKPAF